MFQNFDETSQGEKGAERLAALRVEMARVGLDAFIVPRADAYQGEYVAECDARLAWLTGFTGSAGFCAVICEEAGVFADGRYTVQVRAQIDQDAFTAVDWPKTRLGPWLAERLPKGAKVGFDAWLHTEKEIAELQKALADIDARLVPSENLVDCIWTDRPDAPAGKAIDHPIEVAGQSSGEKRENVAAALRKNSCKAVVLTLPDSISWLLNIRGTDIPRVPIVQSFAIVHDTARVTLFASPDKFEDLGADPEIDIAPQSEFVAALGRLSGPVQVDKASAPFVVKAALEDAGTKIVWADDPCQLPKACKNNVEVQGARDAHIRDGAAMVKFLHWVDVNAPTGSLTEISVAQKLEEFRRENNQLLDISFETISATGPNAALPHYSVSTQSNRKVEPGQLLLVDSGGQYRDGTTDITRTMATGITGQEEREAYTRVLQGMIAISRVRFPNGMSGRDLDALARYPLWLAGQDYDHGTGHGVGSYLSVHEGPQRISRLSETKLQAGMILSNEPGYYREGKFGIRIENLLIVQPAPKLGDNRDQLCFETITYVPIDTRLIALELLSTDEMAWLNAYHAEVAAKIGPLVEGDVRAWLETATRAV